MPLASTLNLTDDKTQIHAVLSSRALDAYNRDFPTLPLKDHDPKHYKIELVDFEIVFGHSTSEPTVFLFVKQFNIQWALGKTKAPTGKKMKKHKNLWNHMCMVFNKAKNPRQDPGIPYPNGSNESVVSQDDGRNSGQFNTENSISDAGFSQEFLMSQLPLGHHPAGLRNSSTTEPERGLLKDPVELLGHLGPNPGSRHRTSLPKSMNGLKANSPNENSHASKATDDDLPSVNDKNSTAVSAEEIPGGSFAAKAANEQTRSEKGYGETGSHLMPVSKQEFPTGSALETPAKSVSEIPSTKSGNDLGRVETASQHSRARNTYGESNEEHMKLEGINTPSKIATSENPFTKNPPKPSNSNIMDPWYGLRKIRRRDVEIPKDQATLLRDHTCWFPPFPGKPSPSGNVPTNILSQWNEIVLQRSRLADEKQNKPESSRAESPTLATSNHVSSAGVTSPISPSGSESASQAYSWCSSPNRDPSPHHELPADSPPVSARPRPRESQTPKPKDNGVAEDQSTGDIATGAHVDSERKQSSEYVIPEVGQPPQNPRQAVKNSTNPGLSQPMPTAQAQELDDGSDDESNESVMDAAVPCPLGYSSQPASSAEQAGKEPISSSASLPWMNIHEHVQVTETPAMGLNRVRPEITNTITTNDPQQHSSLATKSSSQRVYNTYASNDNVSNDGSSQESHYSSQHGPDQVRVEGTQISSGNWTTHSSTPNSHIAFVPNSSGSYGREQSVPLSAPRAQEKGTPQPFSSYRDVTRLRSDDDNYNSSDKSSAKEASIGRASADINVPSLKRHASVIETEPFPSKRQRTRPSDNQSMERESKRSTSNVMSRRESYINSTPNRPDAKRAYEKFRSNYRTYTGDSAHFFELCSRLQTLRDKGRLKRSHLWDDFIIMHLEQYPSYLQLCHEMGNAKIMGYEEYFESHFSHPSCKKRSLTAAGIEVSAAQHAATSRSSVSTSPSVSHDKANTSFTASLANRLSNFHTHSFGPGPRSNHSSTQTSRLQSVKSPTRSTRVHHDPSSFLRQNPNKNTIIESVEPDDRWTLAIGTPSQESEDYNSAADEPAASKQLQMEYAQSLAEQTATAETTSQAPTNEHVLDKEGDLNMEMATQPLHPEPTEDENEVEPSIPESNHDENNNEEGHEEEAAEEVEEYDEMEATHETASIELGDERPSTEPQGQPLPEALSEDEDGNENWFSSLRHIIEPPTGVWSDDPNTPFKIWARADQNVKVEILRRGGRYREVDDKGVIQQSLTHRRPGG